MRSGAGVLAWQMLNRHFNAIDVRPRGTSGGQLRVRPRRSPWLPPGTREQETRQMGQQGQAAFDPGVCFVRMRKVRSDGFVEFDFAIGEPDLSVELILPAAAFHEFCRANQVIHIGPIEGVASAGDPPPASDPRT
jgi:phenol/toluene 2-monooxygenase (NADH) P0/A0